MWKLQENILSKQDKQLASDFLIKSDRLTQFEYVKDFEKNWSTWQGCKFSTYVNSGSSADLIMLDAVKEFYKIDDFDVFNTFDIYQFHQSLFVLDGGSRCCIHKNIKGNSNLSLFNIRK